MKKKNWARRTLAMVLAVAMCVSVQIIPASACENVQLPNGIQTIEEAGISKAEAIDILGVSEEEAKDMKFYSIDTKSRVVLKTGDVWEPSPFTFTGENVGSYFTVKANQLRYGFRWKPASKDYATQTTVYLFGYGLTGYVSRSFITSDRLGSGGTAFVTSDWISTKNGLDYHFSYDCYYIGSAAKPAKCTITLIVGVA